MGSSEPTESTKATRRSLLVAAGGITITGVSSGRVAADSFRGAREEIVVSRDNTLRSDLFDRAREETAVPVTTTEQDVVEGIKRFVAGEVDLVHARRPLLPSEKEAIGEERRDTGFESIAGTAFAGETGTWRSPLQDEETLTFRESNPRAGTWAELTDRSAPATAEFEKSVVENLPDGEVVARGVRPSQYARGHGGLGYYRLPGNEIVSGENAGEGTTLTPLVQLQYTYVNGQSRDRSAVERYLDLFVADAERYGSFEPFPELGERTGTIKPLY